MTISDPIEPGETVVDGYKADPEDVEALLQQLCGDLLDEEDWLIAYTRLTAEQARFDALVSAIKSARGRRLTRGMREGGLTETQIGQNPSVGLSQQVVNRLIQAGKRGTL